MLGIAKLLLGLQFVAAVGGEVAANSAPVAGGALGESSRSETTVTSTLTPSAGWEGLRGRLSYDPRASWRFMGTTATGAAPLLLHQLNLTYLPVLQARTQLSLGASAALGDVDTAAQRQVFANNETAPLVEDLRIYTLSLTPALTHRFTRLWSGQLSVLGTLQGPFGKTTAAPGQVVIQDSRSLGLVSGLARALSNTRDVQVGLSSLFAEFESSFALSTTLLAGIRQVHSRTTTSTVNVGAGRTDVVARDDAAPMTQTPAAAEPIYFAAGNFGVNQQHQHGATSLRFVVDARVDPFSQTLRPTASLVADSALSLSKRVSLSGSLGASTVTTFEALPADPNETGVNVGLAVAWRLNDLRLQGGVRGALRGPNLDPDREESFKLRERTASAFISALWLLTGEQL